MTTVISIIVAVGLVGFIFVGSVIEHGKLLNTKEDFEEYEKEANIGFSGRVLY